MMVRIFTVLRTYSILIYCDTKSSKQYLSLINFPRIRILIVFIFVSQPMKTHFKNSPIQLSGDFPSVWSQAKEFALVNTSLETMALNDFKWYRCILNIFPSIDTEVCGSSVKTFSKEVKELENTKLLCISRDLPFAQHRFLEDNGVDNVIGLSDFRQWWFGIDYWVTMTSWPLAWLLARCVIVLDESWKIIYTQLVEEVTTQPSYSEVLKVLS
jgi:thiol peroxidase